MIVGEGGLNPRTADPESNYLTTRPQKGGRQNNF